MFKKFLKSKTDSNQTVQTVKNEPVSEAPAQVSEVSFDSLGLHPQICKVLTQEGYKSATPIQAQSIPHLLKGKDILGCAQTGTGKTAAFALPILHNLTQNANQYPGIKVLVLTPTRELAIQVGKSFAKYGKFLPYKSTVVYGGVRLSTQRFELKKNPDILVATPGRFLDLKEQGLLRLGDVQTLVLDEADRMLDMGFINDVKEIISFLPKQRQNLLFSATMPKDIEDLTRTILKDPARVTVNPVTSTNDRISQFVYYVGREQKRDLLLHILKQGDISKCLVFTRTKINASRVSEFLNRSGIRSEAIHGDKSQQARQKALENFRIGRISVLVASDVAARGINVSDISHVINFNVPEDSETYVHRIGRTARAMNTGVALTFCDGEEYQYFSKIQKFIKKDVPVVKEHPFYSPELETKIKRTLTPAPAKRGGYSRGGYSKSGGRGGRSGQSFGGGRRQGGGRSDSKDSGRRSFTRSSSAN